MPEKEQSAQHFIELIQRSKRGKFKIYIGMSAGVGKTYRMLQEAHSLLKNGIDVKIGYIETHGRKETHALLLGLPIIPRRKLFYKGKELEEMDLQAILTVRPEVVIVDELAHTNIEGSQNEKRWQDVLDILKAGINVISAVNIQHIESINDEAERISGATIQERVPDSVLLMADEVVNIDLTAEELITRLKEGKIYDEAKVQMALGNFFQSEKILQLRELALKEVARQVVRKIDAEIPKAIKLRAEVFMACISTNDVSAKNIIRKTARLAAYYNSRWFVLYVQTPRESADKIRLNCQRHLINNFKLATELGGEVIKLKNENIAEGMFEAITKYEVTTLCLGKPEFSWWKVFKGRALFEQIIKKIERLDVDLVILS
ncbi:sensor protein KdpD [Solitalea koreensis]|uniref:Two-component system, OmpR family, sensor histidine kinase KdpD n=1 Tax=Solitalea koreensis TaxID=543615 RepID=A0A521C4B7_9SPHI|nr:sensor protein KdpD [Solitalea koreensis]SMO54254.1 two-component system, OmpR family, sensor histidine kinase KdpD [Solitalea koreensis]